MDDRAAMVTASTNAVLWFHTDRQGSVVATSGPTGTVTASVAYSPYGEASASLPPGGVFGYTGRQYDPETGLYQYRARYYSPRLGQFLSTDPIGTKDDPNLYGYVANDPVNSTDPTGLENCKPDEENCIETPESAAQPGNPLPPSGEVTKVDDVVITAQRTQRTSSGSNIDFGGEEEQFFTATTSELEERNLRQRELNCGRGVVITIGRAAPLQSGQAAAHSHTSHEGIPGSGDGLAAGASTLGAAYVMTPDRAFRIEAMSGGTFRTTLLSGPGLTGSERSALVANMRNWESGRASDSSRSDRQRFCP